jgi:hypothetical protein
VARLLDVVVFATIAPILDTRGDAIDAVAR